MSMAGTAVPGYAPWRAGSPPVAELDIRSVVKRFGGLTALDRVSLQVGAGEAVGVIGPNGAGKSTLLRVIAGGCRPDAGSVHLAGVRLDRLAPHAVTRAGVALAHQVPRPFPYLSVRDNVRVGAVAARRPGPTAGWVDQVLRICRLDDQAGRPAGQLGLLDLKRLELARALATNPQVLLADEVAAGLVGRELDQVIDLVRSLRASGRTLVLVEHVQRVVAAVVDRVVVLDWGREIAAGSPAEVAADPRVREIYLGAPRRPGTTGTTSTVGDPRPAAAGRARVPAGATTDRALLRLEGISAGYGDLLAIREVTLRVDAGELVCVLGANGAGKSTLAATISGLIRPYRGRVLLRGRDVTRLPACRRARLGIAHCPEGRRVFTELTVRENLVLAAGLRLSRDPLRRRLNDVYQVFPALAEHAARPAGALSGGQQQMLALGRALIAAPALILCDEVSLGLAPVAVEATYQALGRIRGRGVAILLVEQNAHRGLAAADRVYVLDRGRISYQGPPAALLDPAALDRAYFGVAATHQPAGRETPPASRNGAPR
jgi:branched-chain amino acid transport system ATP-binding protein